VRPEAPNPSTTTKGAAMSTTAGSENPAKV
jgi:hypothetical protein